MPSPDETIEPVMRAVAAPLDEPVFILDEADAMFSKRTEIRNAHDRYEKAGLLAEGAIEPELVAQPIGDFSDNPTAGPLREGD